MKEATVALARVSSALDVFFIKTEEPLVQPLNYTEGSSGWTRLLSAFLFSLCGGSLIKHCSAPRASHVQLMSPRPPMGSSKRISMELLCILLSGLHPFTSQHRSDISKLLLVE